MLRLLAIVGVAHAATLSAYGPASAASDITLAALATGRLYVVGITERPNMPVVLDQQFRTESDDRGIFQYKLVYHPARCIISATIEGKSYEAVVSNCGQQGSSGPSHGSAAVEPARPQRALGQPADVRAPAQGPRPHGSDQPTEAALPTGPVRTSPLPSTSSAMNEDASRMKDEREGVGPILHPPLPPERPRGQFNAEVRSSQAAETTKHAKPVRRGGPHNLEGWLSN